VKKRENLEMLHYLGTAYHQRPSSLLGIRDEWAAYQLDVVTLVVGKEAEAQAMDPKRKAPKQRSGKRDYVSARGRALKKVNAPDGVW